MGKIFWGLILSPSTQLLLSEVASDKHVKMVTRAPEALDLNQLQTWINGSIWALVALNLVAFFIFLVNALFPQWKRFLSFLSRIFRKSKSSPVAQPTTTAEPNAPSPSPEPKSDVVSQEPVSSPSTESTGVVVEPPPVTSFATPKTPPAPAPTVEAAPAEEVQKTEESPSPPPGPQEVVEEIDLPKFNDEPPPSFTPPPATEVSFNPLEALAAQMAAEESATPSASVGTEKLNLDVTEELPRASEVLTESNPLPESIVSDETITTPMPPPAESLKSIEETLNEALASSLDTTEELSIFDPSVIDEVLKEEHKK